MKWNAAEVVGFLERLAKAGGYASVPEMARDFRLSESTPRKWPGARRGTAPPAFVNFLARFAEKHECDPRALRDEWAIRRRGAPVIEPTPLNAPTDLSRVIDSLRTNGRPDLVEHLERQAEILASIPELVTEVQTLREEVRDLRSKLEQRDVHDAMAPPRAPKPPARSQADRVAAAARSAGTMTASRLPRLARRPLRAVPSRPRPRAADEMPSACKVIDLYLYKAQDIDRRSEGER